MGAARQDARRQRTGVRFDSEADVTEVASRLERRYEDMHTMDDVKYDDEGQYARPLPSARDPSIWGVPVKIGEVQRIVLSLTNKMFGLHKIGKPSGVISVFHNGGRNWVYLECLEEANMRKFIQGMEGVYAFKATRIPEIERTQLFEVSQKSNPVKPGMWVRCRKFPYRGDLAQIVQ